MLPNSATIPARVSARRPRAYKILMRLHAVPDVLLLWLSRARQRRALAALDDRLLGDVGISRSDAAQEAGKPFWMR
jgi:uncharacterized protein YjiS (DUF1127 family)